MRPCLPTTPIPRVPILFLLSTVLFFTLFSTKLLAQDAEPDETPSFDVEEIATAAKLFGLEFTAVERDSMREDLGELVTQLQSLRAFPLANDVPPALRFDPVPAGFEFEAEQKPIHWGLSPEVERPEPLEAGAFYTVRQWSELIRTRQVTSVELTEMYLSRLERHGPTLQCVVTVTRDRAIEAARRADREIAAGHYRGPLHGIPFGAKDLLAVEGYKTTWGAAPFADQVIDETATVIRKLEAQGAVLVAKLTLGALAWGDVWYGGKTRNPWNLEQGSSGSSAGSASATAAGLVGFSIGTETWGSIVSPSTRCGTSGLRPTYGRVSRTGAMALSWSMDKIGPICRSVEDCALVFDAIRGPDGIDQTLYDVPFNYSGFVDLSKLRIGIVQSAFDNEYDNRDSDQATLAKLTEMGAQLVPVELPDINVRPLSLILSAEAAAAFDELTRSGRDDLLVRQIRNAWPNVFRQARFIPAVEYIQANRVRYEVIQSMSEFMQNVDLYITPTFGSSNLLLTNLTGHPCVVLPNGFTEDGAPVSITFMGQLFDEARLLAVAKQYQEATDFHLKHPEAFQGMNSRGTNR